MKTKGKKQVFDIIKFLNDRPLSWSMMSCFEWNPEDWYQRYVLKKKPELSQEMIFGKKFADSCQARKPMAPVTMLSKMEHKFAVVFNKIKLNGYADTFDDAGKKKTGEYKTGIKPWDQKRADNHGQLTMYALMNYITSGIKPEDCKFFLEWIPTKQNGDYSISLVEPIVVHHFDTKRTMKDILDFSVRINRIVKEMEAYARKHK